MTSKRILDVLPECSDTVAVEIDAGILDKAGALFAETFPGRRAIVVADGNTWTVAGERVQAALTAAGVETEEPYIFPGTPTLFADEHATYALRDRLAATDALACAVASGSLNDITKWASSLIDRPYAVVCTAASVDGYTSFGAAITVNGVKGTQECPAPRAVLAPLDIMAGAPTRLTATGYGDLFEKVPAGADWIIADELGIEAVDAHVWDLVQGPLGEALSDPEGLTRGDLDAMTKLTDGLMMSGLAMQVHRTSRPASGAGHYFSHQWEMEGYGCDWDPPLSHGFKVGLGTLAMCALYESVLALDLTSYDIDARLADWPTPEQDRARVEALQPNDVIRASASAQSAEKYLTVDQARARLERIKDRWPAILERIRPQLWSADRVETALRTVGAIHHPEQIKVSLEEFRTKYYQAQTIRTRYTVLDTLQELGLLNDLVDALFAPEGYWGRRPTAD